MKAEYKNKTMEHLCKNVNSTQDKITNTLPLCKVPFLQEILKSLELGKNRLFSEEDKLLANKNIVEK